MDIEPGTGILRKLPVLEPDAPRAYQCYVCWREFTVGIEIGRVGHVNHLCDRCVFCALAALDEVSPLPASEVR